MYAIDITSKLPNEIFIYNIFRFLDCFEVCEYAIPICFRWHILGQKSLEKRNVPLSVWKIRKIIIPNPDIMIRLLELNTFNLKECISDIVKLCGRRNNIETHWKVLVELNEHKLSENYRIKEYDVPELNEMSTVEERFGWIASIDTSLDRKFDILLHQERSMDYVIKFAEFIEGYFDETELGKIVKNTVNYLIKFGTIRGIISVVEKPYLLTKLPAMFTNELFFTTLEFTSASYYSGIKLKSLNFCKSIINIHKSLPEFDIYFNDFEMFAEIIDLSDSPDLILVYLSAVMENKNFEERRELWDNLLFKEWNDDEKLKKFFTKSSEIFLKLCTNGQIRIINKILRYFGISDPFCGTVVPNFQCLLEGVEKRLQKINGDEEKKYLGELDGLLDFFFFKSKDWFLVKGIGEICNRFRGKKTKLLISKYVNVKSKEKKYLKNFVVNTGKKKL